MNYYFDNKLVIDSKPLNTTAIDGLEMIQVVEDGRGLLRDNVIGTGFVDANGKPVAWSDEKVGTYFGTPAASYLLAFVVKSGDLVSIVHPTHIIKDENRLSFFTGLLTNGVRIACLTTGEVFEPTNLNEATELYTRWNITCNEVAPVNFCIY
jgi:hypothetical protein